jgi:alkylation response protein AidB-like acyl-CoA dehydrogenase
VQRSTDSSDLFASARESPLPDLATLCDELRGRDVAGRVALAARAATLGQAFAAGYLAATLALTGRSPTELVSLSFTEPRGRDRAPMKTRRTRVGSGAAILEGEKVWATLASVADRILVIAGDGAPSDVVPEPLIGAFVARGARGLTLEPMPETPFCPDVPHARLALEAVEVPDADLTDGAYARFVKPFRPLEDQCVGAALARYLTVLALRSGCAPDTLARGVSLSLRALDPASVDPSSPSPLSELAAYGTLAEVARFAESLAAELDGAPKATLQRDLGLFSVALPVRIARRDKALRALRG